MTEPKTANTAPALASDEALFRVRLSDATAAHLKKIAQECETTVDDLVKTALTEFVEHEAIATAEQANRLRAAAEKTLHGSPHQLIERVIRDADSGGGELVFYGKHALVVRFGMLSGLDHPDDLDYQAAQFASAAQSCMRALHYSLHSEDAVNLGFDVEGDDLTGMLAGIEALLGFSVGLSRSAETLRKSDGERQLRKSEGQRQP